MTGQIYEEYWDLTLAWSDFNGKKFLTALKTIVEFIDEKQASEYSESYYREIQSRLNTRLGLNDASIRKGINQCVKLGFINTGLLSYPHLTKEYLKASTDEERKLLFSQIVYSNSSFQRSVTKDSNTREINFVVKTLENMKILPQSLIGALIGIRIEDYPEGYVTKKELERVDALLDGVGFAERKYNQIRFMGGLLRKLNGIVYDKTVKSFRLEQESDRIAEPKERAAHSRDSYLQRLYKERLQQESRNAYGVVRCMVEGLEYPYMVASHIKPYSSCDDSDAFDSNNGLLLSKNVDSLFDKYYISFDDDGKIVFYSSVSDNIKQAWKDYHIAPVFMNKERRDYLKIHRELCEKRNKKETH